MQRLAFWSTTAFSLLAVFSPSIAADDPMGELTRKQADQPTAVAADNGEALAQVALLLDTSG